ncbi:hypothetical protein [Legionella bononiensis]|uniref:Coiled-coil protein n=1 Tax=Legionella bononiensis TaxID=2793102 RepID=A0ABS1WFB0_9GAMM|nr:hypothetical protein [Legionella bononiensis]MBL7479226.1 hypothetical protein [Legionella bononiensis]MBL7528047.1 hypothetical protein [Legionella bononiensis]MBL7563876.1 hypothetical protein [Legionella bononiensis]
MANKHIKRIIQLKEDGLFVGDSLLELMQLSADEFIARLKYYQLKERILPALGVEENTILSNPDEFFEQLKSDVRQCHDNICADVMALDAAIQEKLVEPLLQNSSTEGNTVTSINGVISSIANYLNNMPKELLFADDKQIDDLKATYVEIVVNEWFSIKDDLLSNYRSHVIDWLYLSKAIYHLLKAIIPIRNQTPINLDMVFESCKQCQNEVDKLLTSTIVLKYFHVLFALNAARAELICKQPVFKSQRFPVNEFGKLVEELIIVENKLKTLLIDQGDVAGATKLDNVTDDINNRKITVALDSINKNIGIIIANIRRQLFKVQNNELIKDKVNPDTNLYFQVGLCFLVENVSMYRPSFTYKISKNVTFAIPYEVEKEMPKIFSTGLIHKMKANKLLPFMFFSGETFPGNHETTSFPSESNIPRL